mgnify:CR=1 FL=1
MLAAFITHADCARHEMGPQHPECPERLGAIHDLLLVKGLLDYMSPYDAPLATPQQLARAHSAMYVQELLASAPTQGHRQVDPDTAMCPHTVQAALRAAGAAVQATDLVLGGEAPAAFCCVRPPGHHAERAAAMGFCFFNNVAVGIRHALDVHGLQRVALIDFDVHHGNGSEDIFRGDERVLMCSIFERGLYPFNGDQATGPNMVNVGLPSRSGSEAFRAAVSDQWLPALEALRAGQRKGVAAHRGRNVLAQPLTLRTHQQIGVGDQRGNGHQLPTATILHKGQRQMGSRLGQFGSHHRNQVQTCGIKIVARVLPVFARKCFGGDGFECLHE